jgi:O-antigen chain-terminating methyltransferase
MNLKADKSELESKADKSELESKADKSELESKADKSELESKADKSELESKADKSELESKADKSELENKVTYKEFDLYLQTISYAKEYMKISQKNMQNLIAEAQKRLPDEVLTDKDLKKLLEEEKHKYDNFYVEFEDRFRGSREDIKERLKVYLPYIKKLPFEIEGFSSLDVGCGRGEFLELLKENSYEKVKGIDINRVMVAKSKELGLNVEEVDVIEYLSNLQDESLSVITGFHIIEHLSFEVLMKLFEESYRVLKKGGMVIFETPNPENLVVGACNFYIDPTHRNPLPPQMIEFIVQNNNFTTEIKKLNGNFGINYEDSFLNHQFASQLDYAVIGYKK